MPNHQGKKEPSPHIKNNISRPIQQLRENAVNFERRQQEIRTELEELGSIKKQELTITIR